MTQTPQGPQNPPPPPPAGGKDWLVTLLLAIFLGEFGVHRFFVGKIGTGVLMLLTGGVCGILWVYDIIMIALGEFDDKQGRPLVRRSL
ncbi:MAG: TM2 domain-containing protein [Planctomycetota bacterium]